MASPSPCAPIFRVSEGPLFTTSGIRSRLNACSPLASPVHPFHPTLRNKLPSRLRSAILRPHLCGPAIRVTLLHLLSVRTFLRSDHYQPCSKCPFGRCIQVRSRVLLGCPIYRHLLRQQPLLLRAKSSTLYLTLGHRGEALLHVNRQVLVHLSAGVALCPEFFCQPLLVPSSS